MGRRNLSDVSRVSSRRVFPTFWVTCNVLAGPGWPFIWILTRRRVDESDWQRRSSGDHLAIISRLTEFYGLKPVDTMGR
jgi:hypothetical protein